MQIDIKFIGAFRDIVKDGKSQVTVNDETTVKSVIEQLAAKYGNELTRRIVNNEGQIQKDVNIIVGENVVHDVNQKLGHNIEDIKIFIMNPVAGGSPTKEAVQEDVWIDSMCSTCYSHCPIRVHRKNGVVVKIEGNPDCPSTNGRLCAKGLSGIMLLYDPNRVNTPLKRTNPEKGIGVDPKWEPISWDEAINITVEKLAKVRSEDPRKLLVTVSTGNTALHKDGYLFAQAFGTINAWNSGAGTHCGAAEHIMGAIMHHAWAWQPDPDYTRLFLNFGSPAGFGAHYSNVAMSQRVAEARIKRMKHIVIDPWMGMAAEKADEWIPIRPGTDACLVLSMINLLLNEYHIYDSESLKHHTNAPYLIGPDGYYVRDTLTGKPMVWDALANAPKVYDDSAIKDFALDGNFTVNKVSCKPAFALLKEHVKKYTPDYASEITTIPGETIKRLAKEFGETASIGSTINIQGKEMPYRPVMLGYFKGPQGHRHAAMTAMAFETLTEIIGSSSVPGGLIAPGARSLGNPWNPEWAWEPRVGPDGFLTIDPRGWPVASYNPYPPREAKLPQSVTLIECVPTPGSTSFVPMVMANPEKFGIPYKIEAHLNFGSNYLLTCADPALVAKAFKDVFTVSFNLYLDESTDFADIVLPDACYLERYDIDLDWPTVCGAPTDYWTMHLRQPVIKPQYERRQTHDIILEIADRLGMREELYAAFNFGYHITGEYALNPKNKYTLKEIIDRRYKSDFGAEHGVEWFEKNSVLKWPKKVEEIYWRPFVPVRVPIYFEFFKKIREQVQRIKQQSGIPFDVEDFQPLPDWKPCPSFLDKRPDYDLYAIYFRAPFHSFTFTNNNAWLDEISRIDPYNYKVTISHRTAAAKGIKEGDKVTIESASTGEKVKAIAHIAKALHPEIAAIAGSGGHWSKNLPIATQEWKGINFEWLLPLDFEHVDTVSFNQDLCVKVKISKLNE